MAISPPNFAKNAIPTVKGWVSPKGELLKAQKLSQADIDEYNGVTTEYEPDDGPLTGEQSEQIQESAEFPPSWPFPALGPPDAVDATVELPKLSSLTKAELEEYARTTFNVELDRRLSKKDLIEQVGQLQANQ